LYAREKPIESGWGQARPRPALVPSSANLRRAHTWRRETRLASLRGRLWRALSPFRRIVGIPSAATFGQSNELMKTNNPTHCPVILASQDPCVFALCSRRLLTGPRADVLS
jgi:hypothetical protein